MTDFVENYVSTRDPNATKKVTVDDATHVTLTVTAEDGVTTRTISFVAVGELPN